MNEGIASAWAFGSGAWGGRLGGLQEAVGFACAPEEHYRAKLALAKSLDRRGWARDDILELLRFIA